MKTIERFMHGMVIYSSVALSAVFRPISVIALNENPAGSRECFIKLSQSRITIAYKFSDNPVAPLLIRSVSG
ncbi:hypothetical protein [Methylobacter sp. sgz302048]|uniref:hypothetical protein n=1 Tax=Methylobacter sp. sgz302048 TaxID=3455945 RepID=UPI003FA15FFE